MTVGTQDIFTNNIAGPFGVSAISTDVVSQSNIVFVGNSSVYGNIGTSVLFIQDITALTGAGTVNCFGTVFTTTMNVATSTVNFNSGTGTNVGTVNFTGGGTINLALNTIVTGALTTNTAQIGMLNLANASQWTGAVGGPFPFNGTSAPTSNWVRLWPSIRVYGVSIGAMTWAEAPLTLPRSRKMSGRIRARGRNLLSANRPDSTSGLSLSRPFSPLTHEPCSTYLPFHAPAILKAF